MTKQIFKNRWFIFATNRLVKANSFVRSAFWTAAHNKKNDGKCVKNRKVFQHLARAG